MQIKVISNRHKRTAHKWFWISILPMKHLIVAIWTPVWYIAVLKGGDW
jgi:hypothetical protein